MGFGTIITTGEINVLGAVFLGPGYHMAYYSLPVPFSSMFRTNNDIFNPCRFFYKSFKIVKASHANYIFSKLQQIYL
ncbi:MAG: hypothetical protein PHP25_00570 [Candidatus Moranbacteria bacterium]|nr:hypothetical protein [Candidatus Moranbacteria bacterium]